MRHTSFRSVCINKHGREKTILDNGEFAIMWVMDLIVIIYALFLGSFCNVVAMRWLEGGSVISPSSHCPHCKTPLRWYELVPLFSYLAMGGRCRTCEVRISPLYPFGEAATAVSFYLVYAKYGLDSETLIGWLLSALLILSMLTDIRSKLILDRFTLPAIGLFLFLRIWIADATWWTYLIGGALGFALLFILALLSKGGMGGGDIKLFAAIGAALGPSEVLMSLILSALVGLLGGGALVALGKIRRRQPIPFAPFIWLGTMTTYLYGPGIWNEYMRFIEGLTGYVV